MADSMTLAVQTATRFNIVPAGSIRIFDYEKPASGVSVIISGSAADDLMELLNAAPDEEHHQMILRAAVEGANV